MKNQSVLLISIISIAIGVAIGYAFASGSFSINNMEEQNTTSKDDMEGMHMMPDGTMMKSEGISMGTMDHGAMMVKSEQEFIEGMIPHHQEAIDTAKEVIARGGSTLEIKKLAQDIVVAQEKEIAMMKEWYENWYGKPFAQSGSYKSMMRDLSTLKGTALDKVFLEDMVMHHMGAIMMAESVKPYIKHKEITDLTKAIVETQSEEIKLMQGLIKKL